MRHILNLISNLYSVIELLITPSHARVYIVTGSKYFKLKPDEIAVN